MIKAAPSTMAAALGAILGVLLALALPQQSARADGLTPEEAAIIGHVDRLAAAQIAFLERIVNINSGTLNLAGVRAVGDIFDAEFRALGFDTEWIGLPAEMNRAGHLAAHQRGRAGKRLLLLGHLDTVFPADSPFQMFERDGDTATGPGVADMKSGDAVMLYALKALAAAGLLDSKRISVMLTGDEEMVGRPLAVSRAPMIALGKASDAALNFEGGRVEIATVARRGSSNWQLYVSGRRAHSSGIFRDEAGAGAIFEAARILNAFYDEVRGEKYLTFNAGSMVGGTEATIDLERSQGTAFGKTNVIPRTVTVAGGLRFISEAQKERARAKMRRIVARHLPQTGARIEFQDRYPAMSPSPGNDAIFEVLKGINADLGLPALQAMDPGERGAADISFVAPYLDSIDALGGTGEGAHSLEEEVDLTSLAPMTKRAALLIHRLAR